MTLDDRERAENAAQLLVRQRYERVAQFVEAYYGQQLCTHENIRRALQRVELEANEHGGDYAAGMRHTRVILEEELLK